MNKHSTFNSFLLAVALAVMAWVARKAAESGEGIAAIKPALDAVKEDSARTERVTLDAVSRLDRKIDELVPRREFDSKILVLESENRKADIHLREIDLEILKLKQDLK
jgi:hypothetical protein